MCKIKLLNRKFQKLHNPFLAKAKLSVHEEPAESEVEEPESANDEVGEENQLAPPISAGTGKRRDSSGEE